MSESKGSLKLEQNSSSPSPPQSKDSSSDNRSTDDNSSPPNSNSRSPSTDNSSNENSSPSPEKSPPSPSSPNTSSPPTESPPSSSDSSPSPSTDSSSSPSPSPSPSSSPSSPPPLTPKQQSPPPPSPSKKESPSLPSPSPSPSPPPPMQQSPPPPPSVDSKQSPPKNSRPPPSSPSSTPTPPPPTSPETSKSPTFSTPSTNASTKSLSGSSQHTLAPWPQSSANVGHASSPSEGDSKNETQNKTHVTNSSYEVVIDAAVAGAFFIVVFIALFFILKRTRKHKQQALPGNYAPPHANIEVKSDAAGKESPLVNSSEGLRGQFYHSPETGFIAGSKTLFTYEELMEMTDGFARENIIGEGGFGCVYKGRLLDGRFVAVKRLKAGSGQGDREFKAEVEIISRIHHRHLVSLVGYCIAENQRLLIYDFVGNQTLEHHLHGKDMPVLEWPKRVKIAVGAAKGLAYLHEDCQPRIIHRDIKSANILLEDDFEAQVADFGLARLNDTSQTHVSTRVMGTFGYLAPEYASSGKLTDRSDVFSFGVVLLELITGRKPVDPTQPLGEESLVEWARPRVIQALESGDYSELIDPRLGKRYVESEMLTMIEAAGACVRHSATKRPRMALVVRALDFEGSDLSNGVKVGDSTSYDSGKYSDEISIFRRMAFGSDTGSECDVLNEGLCSREMSHGQGSWKSEYSSSEFNSGELETQPFKRSSAYSDGGASGNYGSGRFK